MDEDYDQCPSWKVNLVLDNDTRIFELNAKGPASLIKYFLLDAPQSVLDKLVEEDNFDKLVMQYNTPE